VARIDLHNPVKEKTRNAPAPAPEQKYYSGSAYKTKGEAECGRERAVSRTTIYEICKFITY
jgi:hypothetical protein